MGILYSEKITDDVLQNLLRLNGGEGVFLQAFFKNGYLENINQGAREVLGIDELKAVPEREILELIEPEDRKNHVAELEIKDEKYLDIRGSGAVRLNCRKSKPVWVKFSAETNKSGDDYFTSLTLSHLLDNADLFENPNLKNRTLLEAVEVLKEPFFIFDLENCQVLFANEAGKTLSSSIGENSCLHKLKKCESSLACGSEICPVYLAGSSQLPSIVEKRIVDEKGREKFYEMRANPIVDANGQVVRIIAHLINITAKKRIESLLRESEERYTSIFENSHSVILLIDPVSGRIADVNEAACKFYGYTRSEFRTMNISDLDSLPAEETLAKIRDQIKGNIVTNIFQHRLKNRLIKSVETTTGKIEIARKDYAYCIITDVTSRCEAEIELKHRYQFETITKSLATKFINLRADELEEGIKNALQRVGEFAQVDHAFIFLVSDDRSRVIKSLGWWRDGMSKFEEENSLGEVESFLWAYQRIRMGQSLSLNSLDELPEEAAAEKQRWSSMGVKSLLAIPLGTRERLLGFYGFEKRKVARKWTEEDRSLLNISAQMYVNTMERMRFEQELEASRDSLKYLSANTQEKIEQVRANIAREVHDELGQLLTALKFDVAWLKGKLEEEGQLAKKCETMAGILDDAVSSVQRISSELRPVLLDDLGLAAAIEWSAREFSERTGISVNLGLDEVSTQGQLSISLFRAAQEALTNIARHSYATEVDLKLDSVENGIKLVIRDNGIGITEKQIKDGKSYGIMGLRERISALGGTVDIHGEKGSGTIISVWTPVQDGEEK